MHQPSQLRSHFGQLTSGEISRRTFLARAAALGVATPVAIGLARLAPAAAQDATPAASPVGTPAAALTAPDSGTEGQSRGAGGTLKLLQWQAPTVLNMHLGGSFKDQLAACLVTEPLIHFLPDGTPIPCLVTEVPSLENGLVAADLLSVTYHLLPGVLWSDGEPLTANDVIFTWKWVTTDANNSGNAALYGAITNIEAVDDLTVKITFAEPQLGWDTYFSSGATGGILPEHILSAGSDAANAFALKPIGTGPYVVDEFTVGDSVQYSANPNYREPNKPFFANVNLKGGGDANTAAQAILQSGDWDFAWNLLVDPAVLKDEEANGKGDVVVVPGTAVEFLTLNFSDPNKEVDGQKSQWQTPNPVLSDKAVRQALALSVDRQTISERFYSGPPGEPPTSNILLGIGGATSTNTTWEYNPDKANQTLDSAGWTKNGDYRSKDGVDMKLSYATSINDIRQKTQAVIKQDWEQIGIEVDLKQIDSAVFFDPAPGTTQNFYHMYWDVSEYAWSPAGPYPLSYFQRWVSDNGENIPQAENNWSKTDESRYNSPEYDALYHKAAASVDPDEAADLFIQMNDLLISDVVVIPIVQRASEKYGILKTLNHDNIAGGPFEALYWNIANWNRVAV
jgi:peptide/nickel transport system substrate-binding protein